MPLIRDLYMAQCCQEEENIATGTIRRKKNDPHLPSFIMTQWRVLCLFFPLYFVGVEVMCFLQKHNTSFELWAITASWTCWDPHVQGPADKKGVTVLPEIMGSDHQEEECLTLRDVARIPGDQLGNLLTNCDCWRIEKTPLNERITLIAFLEG